MALSYELVRAARDIAAEFGEIAAMPGWTDREREALETCSRSLWQARDIVLSDIDHPGARHRRVHGTPAPAASGPGMAAPEAAKLLGISHPAALKRARNRGVGTKAGGSRELRFSPDDIAAMAGRGRLP